MRLEGYNADGVEAEISSQPTEAATSVEDEEMRSMSDGVQQMRFEDAQLDEMYEEMSVDEQN